MLSKIQLHLAPKWGGNLQKASCGSAHRCHPIPTSRAASLKTWYFDFKLLIKYSIWITLYSHCIQQYESNTIWVETIISENRFYSFYDTPFMFTNINIINEKTVVI